MQTLTREQFQKDPVIGKVFELIKQNHQVANHTSQALIKNKEVKDFCVEAIYFVVLGFDHPMYLHYSVSSWLKDPPGVLIRIDSISFYDNHREYESARLKSLHSTVHSDGVNHN